MTQYAALYEEERDNHAETKRELAHAAKTIQAFAEYLRANSLQGDFAEFMLARFIKIEAAAKLSKEIDLNLAAQMDR